MGGGNGRDGVKSGESDSLGQDGGRRLSGGGLRESKGRKSGGGEQRELHLGFFEMFLWLRFGMMVRFAQKLSKRRVRNG